MVAYRDKRGLSVSLRFSLRRFNVENGAYLKLRVLQLGYSLPEAFVNKYNYPQI
jgi:hypothetical protein